MTETPAFLFDTCSIINLSYSPVAALFKNRYTGRAGWTRAVQTELTRQRTRKPPHPQAGRACNWATSWLGHPIEITDEADHVAIEGIRAAIAVGCDDDSLDHLGEAASIHLLTKAGTGRLISDDHGARAIARDRRYSVRAASTVGVLSELLARGIASPEIVDDYLDTLRAHNRMRVKLTSADLLVGDLGPWF
ncbi:hypothetical protein [Acrocarpospora catenulata]|uniref:hypothetical protein n=1 Tax=Acrocarpospora catenulata TaxID=2836182 RepID=UPI001BDB13B4|nr:hypothetical protein [Acrocarpospora catenulata]